MPRLIRVLRLYARRYATFRTCAKALCQEICHVSYVLLYARRYAALCQENIPRFIRVRLYARRMCHGSYVWNDTIKEEEKEEEEEPRIFRRVPRLYASKKKKKKKSHVSYDVCPGRKRR